MSRERMYHLHVRMVRVDGHGKYVDTDEYRCMSDEPLTHHQALTVKSKFQPDRQAIDLLGQELRAGRFTVMAKSELRGRPASEDLHKVLKFDRFPNGIDDARKVVDAGNAEIEAKRGAIYAEAARIIDELILGDAHEALASIRAFEARVF